MWSSFFGLPLRCLPPNWAKVQKIKQIQSTNFSKTLKLCLLIFKETPSVLMRCSSWQLQGCTLLTLNLKKHSAEAKAVNINVLCWLTTEYVHEQYHPFSVQAYTSMSCISSTAFYTYFLLNIMWFAIVNMPTFYHSKEQICKEQINQNASPLNKRSHQKATNEATDTSSNIVVFN